jgi:hypothetical protein
MMIRRPLLNYSPKFKNSSCVESLASEFYECGPKDRRTKQIKLTGNNMKTTNLKFTARISAILVIAAAMVSMANAASNEKGAERLVALTKASRAPEAAKAPAIMPAHRCPSCTDTLVTIVDKTTKGPNHEVRKVARHGCAGCETRIVTQGVGKAKHDVTLHTCGTTGTAPACCASN